MHRGQRDLLNGKLKSIDNGQLTIKDDKTLRHWDVKFLSVCLCKQKNLFRARASLKNLSSYSPIVLSSKQKAAFTLAEVLITLAVIGVVAAITMPTLIQKHNNHVVETRLQKIYSLMNQAILMSEAEYGAKEGWDFSDENFWEKHFAPYIKVVKTEDFVDGNNYLMRKHYLPDGSLLVQRYKDGDTVMVDSGCNMDYFFFPKAKNFDPTTFKSNGTTGSGSVYFAFQFFPTNNNSSFEKNKGFQPFAHFLQPDLSNLKTGHPAYSCNTNTSLHWYCTFLIMHNGWKIPKDYPFKIK